MEYNPNKAIGNQLNMDARKDKKSHTSLMCHDQFVYSEIIELNRNENVLNKESFTEK